MIRSYLIASALSALVALTSCDQWAGNTQMAAPKVTTKITEVDSGPFQLNGAGSVRQPVPAGLEVLFEIENPEEYEFQTVSNGQMKFSPSSTMRIVMPIDKSFRVKFRKKKQGGYHFDLTGVTLFPVRFSDALRAEDWSIVLDRQDPARTRVEVALTLPKDSPVKPHNIYMQAFYLVYGAMDLHLELPWQGEAGSYSFWKHGLPSKRDQINEEDGELPNRPSLEVLDTQSNQTDEGTEISFVVVADTAKLPLGYLCFNDDPAGETRWSSANYIPWANLQVPITNYTDPILLFTKDNPSGVPITPEELKELLPSDTPAEPVALEPAP